MPTSRLLSTFDRSNEDILLKTKIYQAGQGNWLRWFGSPIRYVATGEETDDLYCFSIGELGVGQGAQPHRHSFDEGFYLLDGEVEFVAGSESVVLKRGDFINIRGGTAHHLRNFGAASAKMIVACAPAGFDQFQLESGVIVGDPMDVVPDDALDKKQRARMKSLAALYEIELDPDDSEFESPGGFHVARDNEGTTIDTVGDRYRFLAESSHTGGSYAIWHGRVPPGNGPPLHQHGNEFEAFYVLKGKLLFESDGTQQIGEVGTFVNLPTGSKHRFQNVGDNEAEMLMFVAPGGLEGFFLQAGTPVNDLTQPIAAPKHSTEAMQHAIAAGKRFGVEFL